MDTIHEIIAQLQREVDELAKRVRALQELEDPQVKKALRHVSLLPLQRVYSFSLSLDDRFWLETLKITPEETEHAKQHGKLLSSVRIKDWRSHEEVEIFEKEFGACEPLFAPISPRSLHPRPAYEMDIYQMPPYDFGRQTLWELPLGPQEVVIIPLSSPSLRLDLIEGSLELCAVHGRFGMAPAADFGPKPKEENVFVTVPLDPTKLQAFRVPDDPEDKYAEPWLNYKATPWDMEYAHEDQVRGLSWELYVLDLQAYQDL